MRRLLLTFAAFAAFFQLTTAQEYLPKWQEGYMDIHTIATGRGDATFIVMPDGTTLMIDAGDNGKIKDLFQRREILFSLIGIMMVLLTM